MSASDCGAQEQREAEELERKLWSERVDVTLPGAASHGRAAPGDPNHRADGGLFESVGFEVVEGPEIE
ncbi:MAG: hypothetical protein IPH83_19065 [Gammaproteobacteria bacterium]|nr:hypothetical protein [Gammaproteobacteria bacterium]